MRAIDAIPWTLAALGLGAAILYRLELLRRRAMVARACHELRGPLTAASLALHAVARHGDLPPRRIGVIELELRRAGKALDDFAAARSGRRPADRSEAVDLGDLLAWQLDTWRVVARAYGCEVSLVDCADGVVVRGDRLRLAQAISNLIANAIEHGTGAIRLRVRRTGACVHIDVHDEGPGLPAPVAELVRRSRRGCGLHGHGLAVASEIAARHGGRLAAGPSAVGACLSIELPALAAATA